YSLTPPSLSRILPFTLREPLSEVGQLVELEALKAPYPEPQSNAYVKPAAVSAPDGSLGLVSERAIESPSSTSLGALKVAVGATLCTSTLKLFESEPPSLSVTVTVAV